MQPQSKQMIRVRAGKTGAYVPPAARLSLTLPPAIVFSPLTIAAHIHATNNRTLSKSNGGKDGSLGSPTYHPGSVIFIPLTSEKRECADHAPFSFFSRVIAGALGTGT
jgi:hypothetical protein